ncbi:hypothetical protein [Leuconostoc citreum]|uniref:hypothetical protein n=1 Tax=Leuconostoc citreum TaxID=33964 RepID=UPI0032DE467B
MHLENLDVAQEDALQAIRDLDIAMLDMDESDLVSASVASSGSSSTMKSSSTCGSSSSSCCA